MKSFKLAKRGAHFFITKKSCGKLEAFAREVFTRHFNILSPIILDYYKKVINKFGHENVKVKKDGIIITTDEIHVEGLDGATYELSEKYLTTEKKSWWKPSESTYDQLDPKEKGKKKLKDTDMLDMIQSTFVNDPQPRSYLFDLMDYAVNRLLSRTRDKKTKTKNGKKTREPIEQILLRMGRAPQLRRPTIHSKRMLFSLEDIKTSDEGKITGTLAYNKGRKRGIGSEHYQRFDVEFSKTTAKPHEIEAFIKKRKVGGNFKVYTKKQNKLNKFTVVVKRELTFDYYPEEWIGMDINVEQAFWIVWCWLQSNGEYAYKVFERSNYLQGLINDREDNNETINNKNRKGIKSKNRTKNRIVNGQLSRKQKKEVRKVLEPWIQFVKRNKLGVCIDYVAFGASSGNGALQESICKVLPEICEENGVPYYKINPAFTSRTCSSCGHCHTESQKNKMKDTFCCLECGHTQPIHMNAATNIMNIGYGKFTSPSGGNGLPKPKDEPRITREPSLPTTVGNSCASTHSDESLKTGQDNQVSLLPDKVETAPAQTKSNVRVKRGKKKQKDLFPF